MGNGVARRLLLGGHRVVAYNRSFEKTATLAESGAVAVRSLAEMVAALPSPRTVWFYLPAGEVFEEHLEEVAKLLSPGDVVIDGGNSFFRDTLKRGEMLAAHGIEYLDVGTSGGIAGMEKGYCLMIGGSLAHYERLDGAWKSVAIEGGYQRMGSLGSGHYVKMVHNAIEYGMMQAYGEGIQLLTESQFGPELNLPEIAGLWQHGSIIRSFLGELLEHALTQDEKLETITGRIEDNGEGRWSVEEALKLGISLPVITSALYVRYASRDEAHMAQRVVAILRKEFGGHAVTDSKP
jgi:6-phosphogluconate dehydrogenase